MELDNWVNSIHSACAAAFARHRGKTGTLHLLQVGVIKIIIITVYNTLCSLYHSCQWHKWGRGDSHEYTKWCKICVGAKSKQTKLYIERSTDLGNCIDRFCCTVLAPAHLILYVPRIIYPSFLVLSQGFRLSGWSVLYWHCPVHHVAVRQYYMCRVSSETHLRPEVTSCDK